MNTNPKNSTKFSYDGGHIRYIRKRRTTTTDHQPHNFNKTVEADLGGFGNSKARDRSKVLNSVEYFNRLRRLLNSSHWNSDDISWLYSPRPTRDFSSLFNVKYKEPVIKVPKIEVPAKHKHIPVSTILWVAITFILFLVVCVLKIIAYARSTPSEERSMAEEQDLSAQEPNNDNGPFSNHNHSDFPPTYFECAASSDGNNNRSFNANSEDYSICLETLNNTDEAPTES